MELWFQPGLSDSRARVQHSANIFVYTFLYTYVNISAWYIDKDKIADSKDMKCLDLNMYFQVSLENILPISTPSCTK